MIQLLGLLLISWVLIWVVEKRNLSVLGLQPNLERFNYVAILFIVSAACSASAFLLRMYFAKEEYVVSSSLTVSLIFEEVWNQLRMVLTEELICRGAILYILIKKIGPNKSILISSAIFALLHWLNAGVWGNGIQMAIVFLFTFTMGLLLAYSYARTFSLWIPFAIHFGWNLTQNFIFPDNEAGNHILVLNLPPPSVTVSYLVLFTMLLLPKASVILLDFLIIKRHVQIKIP